MTAVDRAAEILFKHRGYTVGKTVQALTDADLLVTDEIQAVLDAAEAFIIADGRWPHQVRLKEAVDAYIASQGGAP